MSIFVYDANFLKKIITAYRKNPANFSFYPDKFEKKSDMLRSEAFKDRLSSLKADDFKVLGFAPKAKEMKVLSPSQMSAKAKRLSSNFSDKAIALQAAVSVMQELLNPRIKAGENKRDLELIQFIINFVKILAAKKFTACENEFDSILHIENDKVKQLMTYLVYLFQYRGLFGHEVTRSGMKFIVAIFIEKYGVEQAYGWRMIAGNSGSLSATLDRMAFQMYIVKEFGPVLKMTIMDFDKKKYVRNTELYDVNSCYVNPAIPQNDGIISPLHRVNFDNEYAEGSDYINVLSLFHKDGLMAMPEGYRISASRKERNWD